MASPELSVVIPVYRDAAVIEQTAALLCSFFAERGVSFELILIHDGGPEETRTALHRLQAAQGDTIRVIDRMENRGKGYSVREGLAQARGQVLVYTDADLPYDLASLGRVIDAVRSTPADLALANRRVNPEGTGVSQPVLRRLAHRTFAGLVRAAFRIPCSDTQAGLKAMTPAVRDAILPVLTIDRYAFDVELLVRATQQGFRLQDVPATQRLTHGTNVQVVPDSWEMVKDLWRIWCRRQHV